MDKSILISETSKETRVAILEDGELVELYVEKPERSRTVGNIYKGEVENVIPGIQAAFVDIGDHHNAFLPFSEMNNPEALSTVMGAVSDDEEEDEQDDIDEKPRVRKKVKRTDFSKIRSGQEILVQVIKEPFAQKGARVTTEISIPGRFLVLVPNIDYIGISKKIYRRDERRRLRKIVRALVPKGFGLIVRTVAQGLDRATLESDLKYLLKQWQELEKKTRSEKAPALVYRDMEMASSVIRDLLTSDVSKIIIDSKSLYRELHRYIRNVSPEFLKKIEHYSSRNPLFEQYSVEKEFERSLNKKIWLKSGGFIVIEHTEAMTTIDVNSGKFVSKRDHEKTSLKTNQQAAKEIARQLRLRDVGGLIVIDFIDMEEEENKRRVFQELKRELYRDRAKVALSPISAFGLLEMTRQRIRVNLLDSVSEECPVCHGSGRVTSKGSMVTQIESWFRRFRTKSRERRLRLHLNPDMASYIHESASSLIRKIQWQHLVRIKMVVDSKLNYDEFRIYSARTEKDITEEY